MIIGPTQKTQETEKIKINEKENTWANCNFWVAISILCRTYQADHFQYT